MKKVLLLSVVAIVIVFIAFKLRSNNQSAPSALDNPIAHTAFHLAGLSKLHSAVVKGDSKTVLDLIDKGADVNSKSADGTSPLHSACGLGQVECVKILLEHGADIEARDARGDTPLSVAVLAGQPEIAELLLSHGAKTDVENNKGKTPLRAVLTFKEVLSSDPVISASASEQKKKLEACAEILREHGAK